MRNAYLVTYDVSDPDRLRATFKVMRRFGDHLQLSVFRCELSARELVRLRAQLSEVVHAREDQVLVADLGPVDGRGATCIAAVGRPYEVRQRSAIVV